MSENNETARHDETPTNEQTPEVILAPGDEPKPAPDPDAPKARAELSVPEMRAWLRNWVATATGQSADTINESAPMVELGLSSRDAVAMASDLSLIHI